MNVPSALTNLTEEQIASYVSNVRSNKGMAAMARAIMLRSGAPSPLVDLLFSDSVTPEMCARLFTAYKEAQELTT